MKINMLIGVMFTIVSCSTNERTINDQKVDFAAKFPVKRLEVYPPDAGWGGDIKLSYTSKTATDFRTKYEVTSTYHDKQIGFQISLPASGSGKLMIKSTGAKSNNFLFTLASIYDYKLDTSSKFVEVVTADCINMGEYVDSLNKQANGNYTSVFQYKLFFQGPSEEEYAELALNVNETDYVIELIEEEKEYRTPLIKFFTRK